MKTETVSESKTESDTETMSESETESDTETVSESETVSELETESEIDISCKYQIIQNKLTIISYMSK